MQTILVKHTVKDYDTWKTHFDDHGEMRAEYGGRGYRLFRTPEDANELVIELDWDSAENAKSFLEDSDVRDVMTEAGVVGEPEITFLEEIESKRHEPTMA